MSRHGGDCHWETIYCRKCHKFIDEWYDKSMEDRPKNICDDCGSEELSRREDEKLIERLKSRLAYMIKKYEPRHCGKCHSLIEPNMDDPFHPYDDQCMIFQRCWDCPWNPYEDSEEPPPIW